MKSTFWFVYFSKTVCDEKKTLLYLVPEKIFWVTISFLNNLRDSVAPVERFWWNFPSIPEARPKLLLTT